MRLNYLEQQSEIVKYKIHLNEIQILSNKINNK